MTFVLSTSGSSTFSMDLGLCCLLSDNETINIMTILSLLRDLFVNLGTRDLDIWNPCPSKGFLCNFFIYCLVNPSLFSLFVFTFS